MIDKFIKWLNIKITVLKVNKALNIKLTKFQIDYIFYNKPYKKIGRRTGKTLAYILKILLNDGCYHISTIQPDENRMKFEYRRYFRAWLISIYKRLKTKKIVKCTIEGIIE